MGRRCDGTPNGPYLGQQKSSKRPKSGRPILPTDLEDEPGPDEVGVTLPRLLDPASGELSPARTLVHGLADPGEECQRRIYPSADSWNLTKP